VPANIFLDAVLPYAVVNEARTDWRQMLWDKLVPTMKNLTTTSTSLEEAATILNDNIWKLLSLDSSKSIVFRSESTPLIYDPMSTMAFGYASCTGVSLIYVAALRTVGIPARLVGTPAWNGNQSIGNHNWVEVYLGPGHQWDLGDGWAFIEGRPAGAGENFTNPCDKWFCDQSHANNTQFFATRYTRGSGGATRYPMAWDYANTEVMGVDRTARYRTACSKC
jgi:hypothetical protein